MQPVDVMIYLKRSLIETDRLLLDTRLRAVKGIIAPWFAPRLRNIVVVYYNPELTSTAVVLATIRRLGYDARVVSV